MRETKIVLIGAASASFGLGTLADAANTPELQGSTVVLVDTNREGLEAIAALARRMNDESGARLKIEHTADRTEALQGAEFVIISIAVRRNELWRLDFEVPLKYGIKQVTGENGGPGGLLHSMRNIPILLDICRDVGRLCPDALVLNFTNPVTRVCMAVRRHTNVSIVGLCHGIHGQLHRLAQVIGADTRNLDAKAAGINHFTWILDLRLKGSGEDAYPMLRGELPITELLNRRSGERVLDIISGILSNANHVELAVNIPNEGLIPNLPADAIVEVPAVIGGNRVSGISTGPLPAGIATLCKTQIGVQELAVEAAVTGSRDAALRALLADPVVHSAEAAENTLDELLSLEAECLPQF